MKVDHYRCSDGVGQIRYRWRIVDESGTTLVLGMKFHKTLEDCRTAFDETAGFMSAVLEERVLAAIAGRL